jgi:molybdopterin converting factor subunit 1
VTGSGDRAPGAAVHVRVRLFAMQREQAGARSVELDLPVGATVEDAWSALVGLHPVLAPGRPAVRFARNAEYATPDEVLADGDELACIPPVSGGAEAPDGPTDLPSRILELREDPFDASILAELADRLATDEDGAVVGFLGRTRVTAGTPAPGQEGDAARFAAEAVTSLEYEALEPMVLGQLARIADEIAERFGVTRLAIVHRTGEVPLGQPSVAIVACAPHRGEAFEAAAYAMDETKARAPIWKAERFASGKVWIGQPAREGPADMGPADEPATTRGGSGP